MCWGSISEVENSTEGSLEGKRSIILVVTIVVDDGQFRTEQTCWNRSRVHDIACALNLGKHLPPCLYFPLLPTRTA